MLLQDVNKPFYIYHLCPAFTKSYINRILFTSDKHQIQFDYLKKDFDNFVEIIFWIHNQMRRLDKQITDQNIITEILEQAELCRLGLVENGEAYIVPVNYAYENGVIYIHSAHEGRKMDIIRNNNLVTFEVEGFHEIVKAPHACGWTTRYRSVMGRGTISISNDYPTKQKALDLIMRKYGADIELVYDPKILDRMLILELRIDNITGKQSGVW